MTVSTKKQESFYEFLGLTNRDIELSIGNIDIYIINKKYCLFYGKEMLTETVENAYGIQTPVQPTLQDAVDVALQHEHPMC